MVDSLDTRMSRPRRDYRLSHLGRGDDYDDSLSLSPWARYMSSWEHGILTRQLPRLFPAGIPSYLDFACGTGRITAFLEHMATKSYGVDVSASMLEQARHKCTRTIFYNTDLTVDDFHIEPMQLITAFRFFGNAQAELRLSALRAIRAILVPRGYLVFNNHKNTSCLQSLLRRLAGEPTQPHLGYLENQVLRGACNGES